MRFMILLGGLTIEEIARAFLVSELAACAL